MLSKISWEAFLIFIALSTLVYYLLVYLLYFRTELKAGIPHTTSKSFDNSETFSFKTEKKNPSLFDPIPINRAPSDDEAQESMAYACMDELNAFFENQKKTKALKPELMHSLFTILQKYPSLGKSAYKESITNVIALESENICSIHLSAEELKGVWFGW